MGVELKDGIIKIKKKVVENENGITMVACYLDTVNETFLDGYGNVIGRVSKCDELFNLRTAERSLSRDIKNTRNKNILESKLLKKDFKEQYGVIGKQLLGVAKDLVYHRLPKIKLRVGIEEVGLTKKPNISDNVIDLFLVGLIKSNYRNFIYLSIVRPMIKINLVIVKEDDNFVFIMNYKYKNDDEYCKKIKFDNIKDVGEELCKLLHVNKRRFIFKNIDLDKMVRPVKPRCIKIKKLECK